jgi:pimeloyl-ACP methyl ester carboxylesterase
MNVRRPWVALVALIVLTTVSLRILMIGRTPSVPPPMPGALESGIIPVNGIEMYYAIYGHGTPLLLIHGAFSNANVWLSEIPQLATDHEVIVADSRGQGRSTWNHEAFSYDQMASDYLKLLDYLKINKVTLVGWSDGGVIGIDIAIHHPERLTALFAQAAYVNPEGYVPPLVRKSIIAKVDYIVRSISNRLFVTPERYPDLRAAIEKMWETQADFSESQLASIKVRTVIAIGDHDEVVPRDVAEWQAKTIPGAKLIVLPGVGHMAPIEDPSGYVNVVKSFVDR